MRFLPTVALAFAVTVCSSSHSQTQAVQPRASYPPAGRSVTVPFAVRADFSHLDTTLKLLASVNGGPANAFTIDTGSVGVVLPASEVPDFDPKAPGNAPGTLRYSSSGLTLNGFWTHATVSFLDPANKRSVAESAVQVLAVTDATCQGGGPNAGRCTGNIPHMLGVGFGRGYDAANGMGGQARNPFVNLKPMQTGAMRHGYLITPSGITFGLTGPETRGFQFVKLTPALAPPSQGTVVQNGPRQFPNTASSRDRPGIVFTADFQTAPGFLTLGTNDFPMGTVLIDTGLTNMIVEEPNEPSTGDLPTGQPATVHLLGDGLRYRFTTGDPATPVSPRQATWARFVHGPFLNTGLRALACFDYLYDADNGYLALRPTCQTK